MGPLANADANAKWAYSQDRQAWTSFGVITQSTLQASYGPDLTTHLTTLMCKARYVDGSVANGIARRAQAMGFRGNIAQIYDRLRGNNCTGAKGVSERVLQRLSTAIDIAQGN